MNKYLDLLGFDYYHRNIKKRIDLKNLFVKYWSDKTPEEILVDTDNPPKEGDYFFKTDTNTLYQFQKELSGELIRLVANPINPIPQNSLYIRNDDNRLFKWDGELMKYVTAYPDIIEVSEDSDYDILPTIVLKENGSQIKIRKNLKTDWKYTSPETHIHFEPHLIHFTVDGEKQPVRSANKSDLGLLKDVGSQVHLSSNKVVLMGRDHIATYSGSAYLNTRENLDLNSWDNSIHLFGEHNVEISTGSEYRESETVINRIGLESPNIELVAPFSKIKVTEGLVEIDTNDSEKEAKFRLNADGFKISVPNADGTEDGGIIESSNSALYIHEYELVKIDVPIRTKFITTLEITTDYIKSPSNDLILKKSSGGEVPILKTIEENEKVTAIALNDLNTRIIEINNKIPSQASPSNKLADKEYVNSSIATSTATFRGVYNSVEELRNAETDAGLNDYAYVKFTDTVGNTLYDRYKWGSRGWMYEYTLNNSNFTAAQWAAINSGITAEKAAWINSLIVDVAKVSSYTIDGDRVYIYYGDPVKYEAFTESAEESGTSHDYYHMVFMGPDKTIKDFSRDVDSASNEPFTLEATYSWDEAPLKIKNLFNCSQIIDISNTNSIVFNEDDYIYLWDGNPLECKIYTDSEYSHVVFKNLNNRYKDFSLDIDSASDDPYILDNTYISNAPLFIKQLFDKGPINTTYTELLALKNSERLTAGTSYRITDYVTTTVLEGTRSANHAFDIIVSALDNKTLNENVKAIQQEYNPETGEHDTYFDESNLNAWEIKYCIDNDSDRFEWADTSIFTNSFIGANVDLEETTFVFYNQDLGGWYVWKSIDDEVYTNDRNPVVGSTILSDPIEQTSWGTVSSVNTSVNGKGVIYYMKDEYNNECPYDFKNIMFENIIGIKHDFYYTFSWITNTGIVLDASIVGQDESLAGSIVIGVHNNIIKPTYASERTSLEDIEPLLLALNNIIFVSSASYDNGYFLGIVGNTFDLGCNTMVFRDNSNRNCFGKYCKNNQFDVECSSNIIGNNYQNNICSLRFASNIIGNNCQNNNFTDSFVANIIEMNCNHITTLIGYISNIIIESNNQYIQITSTATSSHLNLIQNFTISQGTNTTNVVKTISHNTTGDTFKTVYLNPNSVIVNV